MDKLKEQIEHEKQMLREWQSGDRSLLPSDWSIDRQVDYLAGLEQAYQIMREDNEGFYSVVRLHRCDFYDRGFNALKVSDEEMEKIASKIGDTLVENGGYWEMIEDWAEELNLPVKQEDK